MTIRLSSSVRAVLWALLLFNLSAHGSDGRADSITLVSSDLPIQELDLVARPDGGFVVAWIAVPPTGSPGATELVFRIFDAQGVSGGAATVVSLESGLSQVRLAIDGSGNLLVHWLRTAGLPNPSYDLYQAGFSSTGERLWADSVLDFTTEPAHYLSLPESAAVAAGGWVVAWVRYNHTGEPQFELRTRRVASGTGELSPVAVVAETTYRPIYSLSTASAGEGALVVWSESDPVQQRDRLLARRLDAGGEPSADAVVLFDPGAGGRSLGVAALEHQGPERHLMVWQEQDSDLSQRLRGLSIDRTLSPSAPFSIHVAATGENVAGASAGVDDVGRAIVAWSSFDFFTAEGQVISKGLLLSGSPLTEPQTLAVLPVFEGPRTATLFGGSLVVAWRRATNPAIALAYSIDANIGSFTESCVPTGHSLCLLANRFRVLATYRDHLGREGDGSAVPLTAESGTFWFFSPASVELIVKVVDACSHPDFENFWVYASGLTDVEVHLTVVDTWTGAVWERDTSLGEPFPPALDSKAFDTCGATPGIQGSWTPTPPPVQ